MPMLDIFKTDAFSVVSLTQAINKMPYVPGYLSSTGLFRPRRVRTRDIAIESMAGRLTLIPTVPRGAPPVQQDKIRRNVRNFSVPRLFKQDQLRASEIQGARAFGSETEVETMMGEVAQIQSRLLTDHALTVEYHLLGAVQGITLDADGSTIYNWFTEWGISQPSEITFSNAAVTAAGGMRAFLAATIVRPMLRAAQVGAATGLTVKALCGDSFFDWFIDHADVKATYLNYAAAADLREAKAFGEFTFGGVTFVNYRGTDDNSTVAIGSTKVKFYLEGVPGLFEVAYSPIDSFDFVNTLGRPLYSRILTDDKRQEYVDIEVESNPLAICTRPETLLRGTL